MNPHNQYVEEDSLELPTPVPTSSIPSVPSSSSTAHTHLNYGNVYVATQYNESSYQPPPYNPAQVPPSKWMETAPPSHGETQKPTESNPKKSRALMYWVIIGFAVVIIVVLAVLLASKPWDQKSSGNGNGNGDANVVSGTSSASATARSTINNGVDRSTSLGTIPIATTNIPQTITTNDPQAITTAARTTTTTNTAASSPAAQRSCLMSDFTNSLDTCIGGSIYQCSSNNVYSLRGSCRDVVGFTIDSYFGGESPFADGCEEGVTGYIFGNRGGHPCRCKDKFKGVGNCQGSTAVICASDGTFSHQVCNTLNGGGCRVTGGQASCT